MWFQFTKNHPTSPRPSLWHYRKHDRQRALCGTSSTVPTREQVAKPQDSGRVCATCAKLLASVVPDDLPWH